MRHKEEFTANSYKELPLEKILLKYKNENELINEGYVFSRFQNLEKHYEKLSRIRGGIENHYNRLKSELEKTKRILSSLKNLKKEKKRYMKGKERSIINKKICKARRRLKKEKRNLLWDIEEAEEEKEIAFKDLIGFERDYKKEMEHVYSEGLVKETFARSRLKNPGKFRIIEPFFIAKYKILPIEELFDSIYLDSTDRVMLVEKGFVPFPIIIKRFKALPTKIEEWGELIKDVAELKTGYKEYSIEEEKVYSKSDDLLYEMHFLKDYVNKQIMIKNN